jgi:hypothetical protein
LDGPARPDRDSPRIEVADILRDHAGRLNLSLDQARAVRALVACRTAALGGHLEVCDSCGYSRPAYNSCRNRHCPKCQVLKQELWAEAQEAQLLPAPYFHLVFTVPAFLHPLFRGAPRVCLGLLFEAVSETLLEVAHRKLKAHIGFFAVLHTWTQRLLFHPHLHCVVPGGGLSFEGSEWIGCGERFFLPVRILRTVFRGKLLSKLERALAEGEIPLQEGTGKLLLRKASRVTWVVYAKPPLVGPKQVVRYLSRYTHRIAISNSRLLAYDGKEVTFLWRDRADGNRKKSLRLSGVDFCHRFLRHVLPPRFVRIRHYGFLSNRSRHHLEQCRALLENGHVRQAALPATSEHWMTSFQRIFGQDPLLCPACRKGRLLLQLPLPDSNPHGPVSPPSRSPPCFSYAPIP